MAERKLKINYEMADGKTTSKTINNINPEAASENLLETANQLTGLQDRTVKSVEQIDSVVISG